MRETISFIRRTVGDRAVLACGSISASTEAASGGGQRAQEAAFLVGYVRGHQEMSELVADREPAALRRYAVLDEDDSATPLAVGQQSAFEALRRERLISMMSSCLQSSSIGAGIGRLGSALRMAITSPSGEPLSARSIREICIIATFDRRPSAAALRSGLSRGRDRKAP